VVFFDEEEGPEALVRALRETDMPREQIADFAAKEWPKIANRPEAGTTLWRDN
jgi:hypothetical protein